MKAAEKIPGGLGICFGLGFFLYVYFCVATMMQLPLVCQYLLQKNPIKPANFALVQMGRKCFLPAIDVVSSEAFPKNVPIAHVATNVDFRGHVQIAASLLTHVDL